MYLYTMETLNARTVPLLGKAIRQLRAQRNMTQAELADSAGVSRVWLNQLESGHRDNAELSAVLCVLEALGVTLAVRVSEGGAHD